MDVAFCPDCKKAGLKHDRIHVESKYVPEIQGFRYDEKDKPLVEENHFHWKKQERWCPRCQKWVKPNWKDVMTRW